MVGLLYRPQKNFTLVLLNGLFLFFIHTKLELLTQFPTSNDKKHSLYLRKIDILTFCKVSYLINWAIYFIIFSDILFHLKHAWPRIYTGLAGQGVPLARFPANRRQSTNVVWMLGQRRRRGTSIQTTLFKCLVFAELLVRSLIFRNSRSKFCMFPKITMKHCLL